MTRLEIATRLLAGTGRHPKALSLEDMREALHTADILIATERVNPAPPLPKPPPIHLPPPIPDED